MNPIVVLGAGSFGTALSVQLAQNNRPVRLWSNEKTHIEALNRDRENKQYMPGVPLSDAIECFSDIDQALDVSGTIDVVMAIPSKGFESVLSKLEPIAQRARLLWVTKGLTQNGDLLDTVVSERPFLARGLLSGPSFANEVAKGLITCVVVATDSDAFTKDMVEAFSSSHFRVYSSDDIVGVELGGVFKNVLAIAVALVEGLGFGMNARAALMTRGLAELRRLAMSFGAHSETVMGLSGVGDMILTCSDNQSRNRRFGLYLAEGLTIEQAHQKIGQVVEGEANAFALLELFKRQNLEAPICQAVCDVLASNKPLEQAVEELLTRPTGTEF